MHVKFLGMKRKTSIALAYPKQAVKPRLYRQNVSLINPPQLRKSLVEKKNFDSTVTLTPAGVNLWSQIVPLNIIVQGTSQVTRIGRKIQMVSFSLKYIFKSTAGTPGNIRIMVVYDKQTNGALPVVTDILLNNSIVSHNNLNNSDRFITVCDVISPLQQNTLQPIFSTINRKINLDTMFSTTAGVITDITSGGLFVMMIPSDGLITDTVDIQTRLRFTDA